MSIYSTLIWYLVVIVLIMTPLNAVQCKITYLDFDKMYKYELENILDFVPTWWPYSSLETFSCGIND